MKNTYLFILFISCCYPGYAQTYQPMLNNSSWYMRSANFNSIRNFWLRPTIDTTIASTQYKKYITHRDDGSIGESFFLREDTTLQQVYSFVPFVSAEKLLYDFSLQTGQGTMLYFGLYAGDQFCTVDTVMLINTCFGPRRLMRWTIGNGTPGNFSTIEQMGAANDHPFYLFNPGDPVMEPVCKFENCNSCTFPDAATQTDSSYMCPLSPIPTTVINAGMCQGDTYHFNGQSLTTTGVYNSVSQGLNGCDSIVQLYLSVHSPTAAYTLLPDTAVAHNWWAIDQSIGPGPLSYLWNWGEGVPDTMALASHTYSSPGYYNICLTVTDTFNCSHTYCDSSTYIYKTDAIITVNVVRVATALSTILIENEINIYPNPATTGVTIQTHKNFTGTYQITTTTGQLLLQNTVTHQPSFTIDVTTLPAGLYFLQLADGKQRVVKKLVKE